MHVLIQIKAKLPVYAYGGTERVVWYLAKELAQRGHQITLLANKGTRCNFASVIEYDESHPLENQIPDNIDLVHMNSLFTNEPISKPHLYTCHGNPTQLDNISNIVFVSKNHALRYGGTAFVYNGMDWDDYGEVNLKTKRDYYHFLGKAAWRVKNVKGAIEVIKSIPNERLIVMGGYRLNLKMGFRFTSSRKISFKGMVGGEKKNLLLQGSKGLIFPVKWHEPFGIAITESLYMGAPVFATPYGSLPELITPEVGFLTNNASSMIDHLKDAYNYSPAICHEYAREYFSASKMADHYIEHYEKILNGETLNKKNIISHTPNCVWINK